MADFEYVGTITRTANRQFFRKAEAGPPRPETPERAVTVRLRYWGREEIMGNRPWKRTGDRRGRFRPRTTPNDTFH